MLEANKTTAWPVGKNQANHTILLPCTTSLSCIQLGCWCYHVASFSSHLPESPVINVLVDPPEGAWRTPYLWGRFSSAGRELTTLKDKRWTPLKCWIEWERWSSKINCNYVSIAFTDFLCNALKKISLKENAQLFQVDLLMKKPFLANFFVFPLFFHQVVSLRLGFTHPDGCSPARAAHHTRREAGVQQT